MGVEGELRAVHAKQEGLDRQLCQIETHQKARRGAWPRGKGMGAGARVGRGAAGARPEPASPRAPPSLPTRPHPEPLLPRPPPAQEVHDALASIEGEAERMFGGERRLMDADAQERDRLYQRAQQVGGRTGGEGGGAGARRGGACGKRFTRETPSRPSPAPGGAPEAPRPARLAP
jgi:hypothetical protein